MQQRLAGLRDGSAGVLLNLARTIIDDIGKRDLADSIRTCPRSLLAELEHNPDLALQEADKNIAEEKLQGASLAWLRLYEDASLSKAAQILREVAMGTNEGDDWISKVVETLDLGIAVSYATTRKDTFERAFRALESLERRDHDLVANPFVAKPPAPPETENSLPERRPCIERSHEAPSFEAFQWFLDNKGTPLIIFGVIDRWPALRQWQDARYFLDKTLGGRRLVPVEIGESYTAQEYRSEIMPFHHFLEAYVLADNPPEVGYLAQHDLFTQIPALRDDILVPDYCYTTPPEPIPHSAAASTPGITTAPQQDEPILNAWLGPKRTKTPLHTDPYHNLLCQVVGYKYVRLYAPENRAYLYPGTVNKFGNDMSNTSSIDISVFIPHATKRTDDSPLGTECVSDGGIDAKRNEVMNNYPQFAQAEYMEAILHPGECLYIPLGWWHYVESLTTSISVSFWWK